MLAKDAPDGFIAYLANPRSQCMGCHWEHGNGECPENKSGLLWCEPQNRRDRIAVVFQPIETDQ